MRRIVPRSCAASSGTHQDFRRARLAPNNMLAPHLDRRLLAPLDPDFGFNLR
jgi:hypothetical protein